MSIKAVKMLVKNPKTTSSDVVNYDFRSPQELQVYLDSIKKDVKKAEDTLDKDEKLFASASTKSTVLSVKVKTIHIDKYHKLPGTPGIKKAEQKGPHIEIVKIPKVENLKKNFSIVTQLHDKLETLEGLETQLNTLLKDLKGRQAAAKNIKSMKTAVLKAIQKALAFLSTIAEKHEPEMFKKIVGAIIESLSARIEGKCDKTHQALYATITEDEYGSTFWFTKYFGIANFKNDQDYTWPNYYVVFTAKIDPAANMSFYVNTFSKFKAPGTFNAGHEFEDVSSGVRMLDSLLAQENFGSVAQRMPLPVKSINVKDLKLTGIVKEINVTEDHSIIVTFTQSVKEKNYEDSVAKTFLELKRVLAPKSKGQLKYKPGKSGSNLTAEFMYLLPDPDSVESMNLNINQVKLLQKRLGLTDKQVEDIIQLLHK